MIKVLVVDDSALIRSLLGEIIKSQPDMQLIGPAPDAYAAREFVNQYAPDVITLDIEMPKVDGLTFLDKLMKARPTPVVMISTLTEHGAEATLKALELGAVDFIPKPKLNVAEGMEQYQADILKKIRDASQANVKTRKAPTTCSATESLKLVGTEKIVAIGASTGGTEAIKEVLLTFPANSPAVTLVQHMPPGFTKTFAARLNSLCKIRVKEAEDRERLLPGHAYLAPGGRHMEVVKSGADYRVKLHDGDLVSGHKPAVDVMFDSLAVCAGKNCVAALLTGMGKDGARGLLNLRQQGAFTLAQDEASCIVYGMPKEAAKLDAAEVVLSIKDMGNQIISRLNRMGGSSRL